LALSLLVAVILAQATPNENENTNITNTEENLTTNTTISDAARDAAREAATEDMEAKILLEFQQYIKDFDRTYNSLDEMTARYKVFKGNWYAVKDLQAKYAGKPNKHDVGTTKFMDMSPEEFAANYRTLKVTPEQLKESEEATKAEAEATAEQTNGGRRLYTLPYSWDWRTQGVVGPVKNQGTCGGCWAFSANVNLEALYARKYGVYRSFSEQQMIDCDYTNNGCYGGNQQNAFMYVRSAGGLQSNGNYPYTNYRKYCAYRSSLATGIRVKSYFNAGQNEQTIMNYVYTTGPLSVAFNSSQLQYYRGGVITSGYSTCSPYRLDHGVAIVGWGSQNGLNYWIVRNSWGPNWGEGGYFRVARGYGTCGINQYVVSATLA